MSLLAIFQYFFMFIQKNSVSESESHTALAINLKLFIYWSFASLEGTGTRVFFNVRSRSRFEKSLEPFFISGAGASLYSKLEVEPCQIWLAPRDTGIEAFNFETYIFLIEKPVLNVDL